MIIVFDFSDTLVRMRPAKLLVKNKLLFRLAGKNKLGIITGARKAETKNILKKLKIYEYFDFIPLRMILFIKNQTKGSGKSSKENLVKQILFISAIRKKIFFLLKTPASSFAMWEKENTVFIRIKTLIK